MKTFKKIIKVILISTLLLLIGVSLAICYLFNAGNLTSLINKQAKNYLKCETTIKNVEPTFFASYPFFGLEINDLCLKDTTTTDTLVYAKECTLALDVKSFLLNNDIILKSFYLKSGYVNVEIDTNNNINLDIIKTSGSEASKADTDSTFAYENIKLTNIVVDDFKANFIDKSSMMESYIEDLDLNLLLEYTTNSVILNTDVGLKNLVFQINDSTEIYSDIKDAKIKLKIDGNIDDNINGDMTVSMPDIMFSMTKDTLMSKFNFNSHIPFSLKAKKKNINFKRAEFNIHNHKLFLDGGITINENNNIEANIDYSTTKWNISELISLVPKVYSAPLKELEIEGETQIEGSIKGVYSDNSFPVVVANIKYDNGLVKYLDNPTIDKIKTSLSAIINLNKEKMSNLSIHNAEANVLGNSFVVNGKVSDFMDKPVYDIKAKANVEFSSIKSYVPKDMLRSLKGFILADIHTKFKQSTIDSKKYHQIYLTGDVQVDNLDVNMNDTMKVNIPSAKIAIVLPSHNAMGRDNLFGKLNFKSESMNITVSPDVTAQTQDLDVSLNINDLMEGLSAPITSVSFDLGKLYARADTISVSTNHTSGKFIIAPRLKNQREVIDIETEINSDDIAITSKDTVMFDVKNFFTKTNLEYDTLETNPISQWKPVIDMVMSDAKFNLGEKLKGRIPSTSFTLTPEKMVIEKANVILGNSDFNLSGEFSNLSKFLDHDALLKGDFDFVSDKTDIMQLMDIFNGMGTEETAKEENLEEQKKQLDDSDPFMVPKGVDIRLNTKIKESIVNQHTIENIQGALTVKDGSLILEQIGFTSKAANMQLTAIYKSPRKNHLFSSIDFHLLNIDIAELVSLVPYVETISPMITSFDGTGDFHLAAETYLKSDYSLKTSTIRGAAAFEGEDLILMDSETFSSIASKLMFENKTENKIDKISVEMTVFRDEIDLYPFLISMDDYSAVISGQVNMEQQINYHVSVTDCPLPFRLGLNINGTIDNPTFKMAACKYKHLYSPKKQSAREKQVLRLKKLISDALKANVKPVK